MKEKEYKLHESDGFDLINTIFQYLEQCLMQNKHSNLLKIKYL